MGTAATGGLTACIQHCQSLFAFNDVNSVPALHGVKSVWLAVDEGLETAVSSVQMGEEGDTDSTGQADRARQKAFGRLETYLDENGGIKDPTKAGMYFSS